MNFKLSTIDKIFTGPSAYPIEMSFFFPCRLDPDFLQSALNRLLEEWKPLGGALRIQAGDAWIEPGVHPLPLLVEELEAIPGPDEVQRFATLRTGIRTESGEPLVRAKLIQGPLTSWLTVGMAHHLGDGYSYFLLMKNLSLVAAGEPAMPVVWDRSSVDADLPACPDEEWTARPYVFGESRERFLKEPSGWNLQSFPKAETFALLEQAQKDTPNRLSLHDWICAYRWKEEVVGNAFSAGTQVRFNTPVDFRRFRKDTLGTLFFGNAVYFATSFADASEVADASAGRIAARSREAIRKVSRETIREQIAYIARDQKERGLEDTHNWNLFQKGSPALVTNLSALPLGEIRLGTQGQAPICVRYTANYSGLSVVLPATDGELTVQSFSA